MSIFLFLQKPEERYVEDPTEAGPNSEQKRWEEEHLNAALMRFGARDAKQKVFPNHHSVHVI